MFVISFMSGLLSGGEEYIENPTDDGLDFDPHKYRRIEKPTSYADTMVHLLKGSIGAGILAMPEAVKRTGVLYGILGLIILGFFAAYTIQLLIAVQYSVCKRWRRGYMAYSKSMKLAILEGPQCMKWTATYLYYFVDIILVLWQLGICCIYLVFVAENIKQLCDFHFTPKHSLRMHLCYLLLPALILNLVKDLKLLSPLSSLSNGLTLLGILLVFFYLIEDDLELGKEMLQLKSFLDIPVFIGTALFALEAVGLVLALEYNMENPKRFVGLFGLFNIGMVIIIVLYILVGVFGYLKYGETIKPSITLNLPKEQKKAQAAKLIFTIAIFFTFPLQNFVAYNILWRRLKKRIPPSSQLVPDYVTRILLVIIPWSLAVSVPKLGPFISLFGALCLSQLAIMYPGIMDICWLYTRGYGRFYYLLCRDVLIIAIGLFCLVSGVYTSMLEIAGGDADEG